MLAKSDDLERARADALRRDSTGKFFQLESRKVAVGLNAGVTLWQQRQPRIVKSLTSAPTIWSSGVKLASVASGQMLTCSPGVWHGPNLSYRAVS